MFNVVSFFYRRPAAYIHVYMMLYCGCALEPLFLLPQARVFTFLYNGVLTKILRTELYPLSLCEQLISDYTHTHTTTHGYILRVYNTCVYRDPPICSCVSRSALAKILRIPNLFSHGIKKNDSPRKISLRIPFVYK